MCTVSDIIIDIRKSLNECVPASQDGCGCNDRYSDDDIVSAINQAINRIVGLRPDQFIDQLTATIPAGSCRVNVCDHGCDQFLKLAFSTSDPCFIPKFKCPQKVTVSGELVNKCLKYRTDAVKNQTVLFYNFDPKAPCTLIVYREDISLPVDVVIDCVVYPAPYGKDDALPEKLCKKFRQAIYHYAIFHLIDRDHRPHQEYLQFATIHRDTAAIIMGDIRNSDGEFHDRTKYLGKKINDCD